MLWGRGIQQVEESDDEGETAGELGESMDVVFRALHKSSMPPAERILWEISRKLEDEYSTLDSCEFFLPKDAYTQDDWSEAANRLLARLDAMPVPPRPENGKNFSGSYKRECLLRWALSALEKAGRENEILPILERETPALHCYDNLVRRLLDAGRRDEALEWARKGFLETIDSLPGIAAQMVSRLRDAAEKEEDWPLVAAYRAMEFFPRPDEKAYTVLLDAAEKAGCREAVRTAALWRIETGGRPDLEAQKEANAMAARAIAPAEPPAPVSTRSASNARKAAKSMERFAMRPAIGKASASSPPAPSLAPAPPWPLPSTGLPAPQRSSYYEKSPDISLLIDIAILEKRPDDALQWYRKSEAAGGVYTGRIFAGAGASKVAKAVAETHPDEALAIWKDLVKSLLRDADLGAYQTAGGYLQEIKAVLERQNRLADWKSYIASIREQNKRRPRMIEVLDRIEGKPSPRGRRILDT